MKNKVYVQFNVWFKNKKQKTSKPLQTFPVLQHKQQHKKKKK